MALTLGGASPSRMAVSFLSIWIRNIFVFSIIFLTCTYAQMQSLVMVVENSGVELNIAIPNSEVVNTISFITIRLDRGSGNSSVVLYLMANGEIKLMESYSARLTASLSNKNLLLKFNRVTAQDAGTYKCYIQSGDTVIGNCGRLLIIIRKPRLPVISMSPESVNLVGSRLQLQCQSNSTSLPLNHGLASQVSWYNQQGQITPTNSGARIRVTAQDQLLIDPLEKSDKGLQISCASADSTDSPDKRILSDPSAVFEVNPEYKPLAEDLTLKPALVNNEEVERTIGTLINYECQATCVPLCNVVWMYKPFDDLTGYKELPSQPRNVLSFSLSRENQGLYQCKAENKHGLATVGFGLKVLYMVAPDVSINGEERSSASVPENSLVSLKCDFDSHPGPVVNWIAPNHTVMLTTKAIGPQTAVENGLSKFMYTTSLSRENFRCEDFGVYRCDGNNDVSSAEGRLELVITCPPSNANIPGLEMKDGYAWKMSQALSFQFVIRAFPEPAVTAIVSSVDGIARQENIPNDIEIATASGYDGKPYLTKFTLTSRRQLSVSDTNRDYTMTIKSTDYTRDFVFKIFPRGPPHKVFNVTAIGVQHDSLNLMWLPAFNGGESQVFSVEYRVGSALGSEQDENTMSWTVALMNVTDSETWIETKVASLKSNTPYVIRVKATNSLGTSFAYYSLKTAAAPEDSLSAGEIVGIVFGVLLFLAIIACLLYFFVIRKRLNGGQGRGTRSSFIPDSVATLFKRDKPAQRGDPSRSKGAAPQNGSSSRATSSWAKVKQLVLRDGQGTQEEYASVPRSDYIEDDHSQTPGINNNAASSKEKGNPVYAELDFTGFNQKKQKDKKKKQKTAAVNRSNDSVNYSDIDFEKTSKLRQDLQNADKGKESRNEEGESLDPQYENTEWHNDYANAGFGIGTTV